MKVTLESTTKLVYLEVDGTSVPARVWQGETESGIPVHAFLTRIAPEIPHDDPRQGEFLRELEEKTTPRAALEAIPLRFIL